LSHGNITPAANESFVIDGEPLIGGKESPALPSSPEWGRHVTQLWLKRFQAKWAPVRVKKTR
jgi:hypothetical protein